MKLCFLQAAPAESHSKPQLRMTQMITYHASTTNSVISIQLPPALIQINIFIMHTIFRSRYKSQYSRQGIKLFRDGSTLTHPADDLIIYTKAICQEEEEIKLILTCYANACGKTININKSRFTLIQIHL